MSKLRLEAKPGETCLSWSRSFQCFNYTVSQDGWVYKAKGELRWLCDKCARHFLTVIVPLTKNGYGPQNATKLILRAKARYLAQAICAGL